MENNEYQVIKNTFTECLKKKIAHRINS